MVHAALVAGRHPRRPLHVAASESTSPSASSSATGRSTLDALEAAAERVLDCADRSAGERRAARAADLLRGDHRHRVRAVPPRAGRGRRDRGRPRRPVRRDERHHAACRRHHDDRARPSAVPWRLAGGDRVREGGHHQAGDARGHRYTARPGAPGRPPRRRRARRTRDRGVRRRGRQVRRWPMASPRLRSRRRAPPTVP